MAISNPVSSLADEFFLGTYASESALTSAHLTANAGEFVTVASTDTVWIWDADTSAWVDSGSGSGGLGTVTNVSSADSNATVANQTTAPVITVVSAPKLQTARTINGVSFDGTANITAPAILEDKISDYTANSTNSGKLWMRSDVYSPTAKGVIHSQTVPTYATWNPSDKHPNVVLSNGNLTATSVTGGGEWASRATQGVSSGKWYWEVMASNSSIGITPLTATMPMDWPNNPMNNAYFYGYSFNGYKWHGGAPTAYGGTFTNTDVIGVALDMDAGTITFYKNGSSLGVAFSGISGTYYPTNGILDTASHTTNFGATAFAYTPPVGFNVGLFTPGGDSYTLEQFPTKTYVDTQDALKANLAGATFTGNIIVPDEAYDATAWNGNLETPTKNAIRDKIESLGGAVASVNGQTGVVVLNADNISDSSTTNKFVTAAEKTKLSNLSGTNTGDQTITLTGDVTGSGTGTFGATLSSTGVGAGTYTNANVTVDSKGRVTTITSGSSGSGGTVSVTNEIPTGTINGSNTVFTISNSATNNEIVVTLNGLKQIETTDYTLSGTTLTFVVAPFTGAVLEVFYVNSTSSAGYQVVTKSAAYTLVNTNYVVLADTTSSSFTLTLPTAVGQSGRQFVLKKVSYNNVLTIDTTSSQTIDGSLTQTVGVGSKGAITVHSDGSNWYII